MIQVQQISRHLDSLLQLTKNKLEKCRSFYFLGDLSEDLDIKEYAKHFNDIKVFVRQNIAALQTDNSSGSSLLEFLDFEPNFREDSNDTWRGFFSYFHFIFPSKRRRNERIISELKNIVHYTENLLYTIKIENTK